MSRKWEANERRFQLRLYFHGQREETAAEVDRLRKEVAKLHKDIHELKRTRSEAEAAAEVALDTRTGSGTCAEQPNRAAALMSGRGS